MAGSSAGERASAGGAILVAIDGEPHTEHAVQRALDLAAARGLDVVAVHVKDPYLKQFAGEIYAQGREEYLAHVERCLASLAVEAAARFSAAAHEAQVAHSIKVLEGDPLEALLREVNSEQYDAVIVGSRRPSGLDAWRSRDLPGKLVEALSGALVSVVPRGD